MGDNTISSASSADGFKNTLLRVKGRDICGGHYSVFTNNKEPISLRYVEPGTDPDNPDGICSVRANNIHILGRKNLPLYFEGNGSIIDLLEQQQVTYVNRVHLEGGGNTVIASNAPDIFSQNNPTNIPNRFHGFSYTGNCYNMKGPYKIVLMEDYPCIDI